LYWFRRPEYLDERCALQGRTALHLAAQYSNVGVMKELVGAGANIGARDDDGMTAAEIVRSAHEQNEEVVSKMLRILES
jgi:ankyrin repeat protein